MLKVDRFPLAKRVCGALIKGIESGLWHDWLPAERELSRLLCISRETCRAATRQLEETDWIQRRPNVGNRIISRPNLVAEPNPIQPLSVGIIIPWPIERMRTHVVVWLLHLRERLADDGLQLIICHNPLLPGKRV